MARKKQTAVEKAIQWVKNHTVKVNVRKAKK